MIEERKNKWGYIPILIMVIAMIYLGLSSTIKKSILEKSIENNYCQTTGQVIEMYSCFKGSKCFKVRFYVDNTEYTNEFGVLDRKPSIMTNYQIEYCCDNPNYFRVLIIDEWYTPLSSTFGRY